MLEPATKIQRFRAYLIDATPVVLFEWCWMLFHRHPWRYGAFLLLMVYTGFQWALLAATGQSVGKHVLRIRIVDEQDRNGGADVNIVKRILVNGLLCLIPGYILIDKLFIFREDRRCLHDYLAGTRVVRGEYEEPAAESTLPVYAGGPCPSCGHPCDADSNFCDDCGAFLHKS